MIIEETVPIEDLRKLRELEREKKISIDSVNEFKVEGEEFADVQIHIETDVGEFVPLVLLLAKKVGREATPFPVAEAKLCELLDDDPYCCC